MKSNWRNALFISGLLFIPLLQLSGCTRQANTEPIKAATVIDEFPEHQQELINQVDPDIINIHYLNEHTDQYAVELGTEMEDYFVIVKGEVDTITLDRYTDEVNDPDSDLPDDIKEVLASTVYRKIYLDGSKIPLTDSYLDGSDPPEYQEGQEYYFYIIVYRGLEDDFDYQLLDAHPS